MFALIGTFVPMLHFCTGYPQGTATDQDRRKNMTRDR